MLFQKDYWKMNDTELEKEASRYHIFAAVAGGDPYFDRQFAINSLLARDQAMRTAITVVSTIVSIVAAAINVFLTLANLFPNFCIG